MCGSRNFRQGGPGQSDKKSSDNVFFVFVFFVLVFLVLSLLYRSQMVNFKEIYHFSRFQRGSNIFQGWGGVQLFPGGGGSNCLFPIETHITCDFPGGGGVRTICPPLDPHLCFHFKVEQSNMKVTCKNPWSVDPVHSQKENGRKHDGF